MSSRPTCGADQTQPITNIKKKQFKKKIEMMECELYFGFVNVYLCESADRA
jgi:hypothetical protein